MLNAHRKWLRPFAAVMAIGLSSGYASLASGSVSTARRIKVVGIAADRATFGYWILKSNGGVDNFHAPWHGSLAGRVLRGAAVTGIAAGRSGGSYLILTSNGAVHGFGTRVFGSDAGKLRRGVRAVGLAEDAATGGYWILKSDGGVDSFHAPRRGSLAGRVPPFSAVTAIAAGRAGGYRVLTSAGGRVPAGLAGGVWNVIPTRRKVVALTFDIGPTAGVRSILATLRRQHAHATFFLTGRRARKFRGAAVAIASSGQLVGNHSASHPRFTTISNTQIGQQVQAAETEIESVTGLVTWPWFRFPFGDHDARTVRAINSLGYVPIGWTVDTLGWKGKSGGITVAEIVRRVLASRRPGEIVLMHGGSDSGDGSTPDADALPTVIRRLRADGYSFVTMNFLHSFGAIARRGNGLVSSFGSTSFGSDGGKLRAGVKAVGLAGDPATGGYWILKSTGGVHSFHAPWRGSLTGKIPAGATVIAIATGKPGGYLVLTSDGGVHAYGTPWYGSDAATHAGTRR
jgi:peptidoglycan/xylan/chitin deacetylase (PgdA/CDA1 family)